MLSIGTSAELTDSCCFIQSVGIQGATFAHRQTSVNKRQTGLAYPEMQAYEDPRSRATGLALPLGQSEKAPWWHWSKHPDSPTTSAASCLWWFVPPGLNFACPLLILDPHPGRPAHSLSTWITRRQLWSPLPACCSARDYTKARVAK